jgi:hypothetical protein
VDGLGLGFVVVLVLMVGALLFLLLAARRRRKRDNLRSLHARVAGDSERG